METGKPGFANALVHSNSVAVQAERRMDIQAPLAAVYIHTGPSVPAQPYPPPAASTRPPATLHLAMPPLYSKETLPFLTFHIAGGLQAQQGLSLAPPAIRPKSAGKHVCPHCGRDCMKPSVLEKHLRCHTGERPYPCTTCGVSFKTQSNLYKHKRTQAHARLSSESEQSSLGSLDSMSSSRETCTSSSVSLDEHSQESSMLKESMQPAAEISSFPVQKQNSLSEQIEVRPAEDKTEPKDPTEEVTQRSEEEKPPLTASRHLPLQRQEATLFSKQWERSVSRGKSQSHESTDSGFSESSDHYPSPGSVLLDHSMDSLTESTKEHAEESSSTETLTNLGQIGQDGNDASRQEEQKKLEERISKLISENSAVVEDKQLENVRPRKTVLSKQGSIDLPMPYTYKDSFHFDMRISKTANVGLQGNRNHGLYSSVPTQPSTSMDHAPVTRSNSLPFSVSLLQPEKSSQTSSSSHQSDYVTLIRRGSSGQINPSGFGLRPVNQQSSTHRPLVRQTAVDCNHATDCLFTNSSVEEGYTGSLSYDGDGGDICGEPSSRKFRRKKAQKFAYNKWYMYGGGTFRKLYNMDKGKSSTNPQQEVQSLQKGLSVAHKETVTTTASMVNFTSANISNPGGSAKICLASASDPNQKNSTFPSSCSALKTPLHKNLSLSVLSLPSIGSLVSHTVEGISQVEKQSDTSSQLSGGQIPSDRKKQKTDETLFHPLEMERSTLTHPPPSVTGSEPQQDTNLTYISLQRNQKHTQLKDFLFQPCIINAKTPSVSTSQATSAHFPSKTSFLPKYQLKLPNATEPDLSPSPHVVDKPTGKDSHNVPSALPSSHSEQATPLVTTSERKSGDPVTSLLMQGGDVRMDSSLSSAAGQSGMPSLATSIYQAQRLKQQVTSSVAVANRQSADTTLTTTCLQNNQAGLCSTLIQPSKSAGASASVHFIRSVPPMLTNVPAASTVTKANSQKSPALSQSQPSLTLPHTHALHTIHQSSPVSRAFSSSSAPIVPCHIVPFDKNQPANQNVFHVQTADLQICLQIISDEQLALIEPQIERQTGRNMEAGALEVIQRKGQEAASRESNEEERHQQPGDVNKSSPTVNRDLIKPSPSVQSQKAEQDVLLTEHSDSSQAEASGVSKPPKAVDSWHRPHDHVHGNTAAENPSSAGDVNKSSPTIIRDQINPSPSVLSQKAKQDLHLSERSDSSQGLDSISGITAAETQSSAGDDMKTAASFEGVNAERCQTLETDHGLSLTQQQLQLERNQAGPMPQQLSGQEKVNATSVSHSTANQKHRTYGVLRDETQSDVAVMKAMSESSTCHGSRSESTETHQPHQVITQTCSVAAGELSHSVSASLKTSRQSNQPAPAYSRDPAESTSAEALKSMKTGFGRASRCRDAASPQKRSQSHDVLTSDQPPNGQVQFSSPINKETFPENPAVLTAAQSPTPEPMGASQVASAAQEEPPTRRPRETSDWNDWRTKQLQENEEERQQRRSGGETDEEDRAEISSKRARPSLGADTVIYMKLQSQRKMKERSKWVP